MKNSSRNWKSTSNQRFTTKPKILKPIKLSYESWESTGNIKYQIYQEFRQYNQKFQMNMRGTWE